MRLMTVVIGVFLLFASSFILRNLLLEDEVVSSEKAVFFEKELDHTESVVIEEEEPVLASTVNTPTVQTTVYSGGNTVERYNLISTSTDQPSQAELEYKSMLVREHRKTMVAEKNSYKKTREEWRAALNNAREEAVISGDYTRYEALKAEEPTKNKRSE